MAENDGNAGDGQGKQEPHEVSRLRELAEEGARTKAQLEQVLRERAFERAGIDIESGPGKLLFTAHQGEITTEAIKAAAEEYGVPVKGATPPPPAGEGQGGEGATGGAGEGEQTGSGEREALANGAPADSNEKPNPYAEAHKQAEAVRARGGTAEEEASVYLQTLAAAAQSGDPRVIVREGPRG